MKRRAVPLGILGGILFGQAFLNIILAMVSSDIDGGFLSVPISFGVAFIGFILLGIYSGLNRDYHETRTARNIAKGFNQIQGSSHSDSNFCHQCGVQLPDEAKFCSNCGTPIK